MKGLKMRKIAVMILLGQLIFVFSGWSQTKTIKRYAKYNDVNLLAKNMGKQIATLAKGTECTVLKEQGEMVQVQITGWVPVQSLIETMPMHALHIMVNTRAEAEDIFAKIRSGKSFEELAKSKSISPTAARGGDLGYFNKGDFDVKVESVIMGLQINDISPIIEFNNKFNIFKRIE